MNFRFRPIQWSGPKTPSIYRRSRTAFRAGFNDTLSLLTTELGAISAKNVVIEADFTTEMIRQDGMPRAGARDPDFPGIRISFASKHGPLLYATDTHVFWQHNIRAIALGLQALRAVDRYGITKSAEQYQGWRAIGTGPDETFRRTPTNSEMTPAEAAAFVSEHSYENAFGWPAFTADQIAASRGASKAAYRYALRNLHPDRGGEPELFHQLEAAAAVLGLK